MRKRVEPVRRAQIVTEIVAQRHVFDPQPDNWQVRIDRELDFAQHLFRAVRVPGKNKQRDLALLNGARDFARKRFAGPNVARRDPAANPALLERSTNRLGNFFVLR